MKLPKSLFTVLVLYKINTKRFFRDKLSIFFGIGFPLIFLFVFGGISSGGGDVSFSVALINHSETKFSQNFAEELKKSKVIEVELGVSDLTQAKDKMSRSEIDAAIVLPEQFGAVAKTADGSHPAGQVKVIYTQNNTQSGQALTSILKSQLDSLNSQYVSLETPFSVQGEQLNEKSLSSFDYAFAGLLGFAIIGMGIFGPVNVFPELKKMGILRRLSTTPLKVWQYFLSIMLGQATTGLLSIAIMFIVAVLVFDLQVVGNYFELALFIALGIFLILGIGLALGGWAKNERQAAPLSNIIVFPMLFLSGTFFPRFLMPMWLQQVSYYLPLTPVIDGIRMLTNEGKHLIDIGPQLGLIGIWIIIIYAVAFKLFRWE